MNFDIEFMILRKPKTLQAWPSFLIYLFYPVNPGESLPVIPIVMLGPFGLAYVIAKNMGSNNNSTVNRRRRR